MSPPSIEQTTSLGLFPAKKTVSRGIASRYKSIYIYIYCTHREWHSWTEDDWSCDAGDRDSLLSSHEGGRTGDGCSGCGEDLLAPPHCWPSHLFLLPSKPQRCTRAWGRHTLNFAWVCVRGLVKQQNRAETLNRHACQVAKDTASWHTSAYFLLNHLSYCFLLLLFSLFFLSILVLSTKIIRNVVLSLSRPLFFPLT